MTKKVIIKMAKQAGFERLGHDDCDYVCYPDEIEAFAKLVAQHEREACAKVCENVVSNEGYVQSKWCVNAIRARGQRTPEGGEA